MRVLVTGGPTFSDRAWLWAGLDLLHHMGPITEIIEGGAPGADVRAGEWACQREVRCTVCYAQWEKHGPDAGFVRNVEMADMKPDVVLACPGDQETAHMVDTATRRGLKVIYLEKMPVLPTQTGAPSRGRPTPIIIEGQAVVG